MQWKCSQGHTWNASSNDRTTSKTGCPVCSNQKVLAGFNDLSTTHPELAKEALGWDPKTVVAGTGKKLKWKCKQGHIWEAKSSSRKSGAGCPVCSNLQIATGFNDLSTTHPELAKEAFGWDPKRVVAGSGKKLKWKCKQGHTWTTLVKHRQLGSGCPTCANRIVQIGYNDLATTHPELATEAFGWDPKTVIAGTNKKLIWKCQNGHVWTSIGSNRIFGRGCPSCAQTGYDPNQNGYLYFLIHPKWEIFQIGITNFPEDRLKTH
jgi:Zn finger protein HypA/HybF involved in hydrogenase expression